MAIVWPVQWQLDVATGEKVKSGPVPLLVSEDIEGPRCKDTGRAQVLSPIAQR